MKRKIEFEFYGKSVYFPKEKILAIADLHLGYEDVLAERGVSFPRRQFKETIEELERIFAQLARKKRKVQEIIILGDIKHELGGILRESEKQVSQLVDFLNKYCGKIIFIKGNHDNFLMGIARKKEIEILDYYVAGKISFLHGHKIYEGVFGNGIEIIVLGHKHPAITLSKDAKRETYKCFLVGKYNGKRVIILPSFFPLIEGSDVFEHEGNLGLKLNLKNFEVYIPARETVLYFGKVSNVGNLI